jgi:beta-1,4-N-acetylglucosaminyltransferase
VSTFVSVGNATQPFTRLLEAVCSLAPQLPQPVFVQFGSAQSFVCPRCAGVGFLKMGEFAQRVNEAELLILHAGAGSVIHAVHAGKVPVVMPRRAKYGEHVDDHQLEFARALAEVGKVVMVEEPEFLLKAAEEAINRQQRIGQALAEGSRMINLVSEVLHGYATGSRR